MRPTSVVLVLVAALACTACAAAVPTAAGVARLRVEVLATQPHDTSAFTQGLEIADGVLYEGTGRAGRSQLRELDPATGVLRRAADVPDGLFGEGITVVGPRIWQLTWQDGVAFEWDRATLAPLRSVALSGEGWGLCAEAEAGGIGTEAEAGGTNTDGARLVRSDGTARLTFHDPVTFAETGGIDVTLDGRPLARLNELECVDGRVWANVWQTEEIVEIDPADGRVTAVVDAAGLLPAAQRADADVLNGIAAAGPGEFLVTGKLWPTTYRVRFVPVG